MLFKIQLFLIVLLACANALGFSFTDITEKSGLAREGKSYSSAAADFDNDGDIDLAVCPHGLVLVYRNLGDNKFENINGENGYVRGYDTHGITWFDYNLDGWLDIFVSNGGNRGAGNGNPNKILINNNGESFFVGELSELLERADAGARSMYPTDFDLDGNLELALISHNRPGTESVTVTCQGSDWIQLNTGLSKFHFSSMTCIPKMADSHLQYVIQYVIQYGGKDAGAILEYSSGKFYDVSKKLGVEKGYDIMCVVPLDYDNDGDLDLYYVSGRNWVSGPPQVFGNRNLCFFINAGTPYRNNIIRFKADGKLQLNISINSMKGNHKLRVGSEAVMIGRGQDQLDVTDKKLKGRPFAMDNQPGAYLWKDETGVFSLALVGKEATPYAAMQGEIIALDGNIQLAEKYDSLKPNQNRLYENVNGLYVDVTDIAGVGDCRAGADAVVSDFDNDGDMDIYLINGTSFYRNVPNVFYRNNGDKTFTDITSEISMQGPEEGRSCSIVSADFDNDGDLDLFYANGGGPPPVSSYGKHVFLQNNTVAGKSCFIKVESPCGVIIISENSIGKKLAQPAEGMNGRFGYSVLPVHMGLGQEDSAKVNVVRPSGKVSFYTVNAGETLFVKKN